jgi:hypothetical protein
VSFIGTNGEDVTVVVPGSPSPRRRLHRKVVIVPESPVSVSSFVLLVVVDADEGPLSTSPSSLGRPDTVSARDQRSLQELG